MTRTNRQLAAVDLAKRAAIYLFVNDRRFVLGGCARLSQTVARFLTDIGYRARVIFGFASDPYVPTPINHAWIDVEGREIDLTWWVQGLQDRVEPRKFVGWHPSQQNLCHVQRVLSCSWRDLSPAIRDLEDAYERGLLNRRLRPEPDF